MITQDILIINSIIYQFYRYEEHEINKEKLEKVC